MNNVIKLIGAMVFAVCSANVFATPITTPMTISGDHIVGIIDITGGNILGNESNEMIAAQALLDLTVGGTDTINFNDYAANTFYDFGGTLTDYFKHPDSFFEPIDDTGDLTDAQLTITGYDFVMAKYDGQSAGYILFALDGGSHILPEYPTSFWTDTAQFQLSHWTAFNANSVPEPGMLALMAIGLLGVVAARRKKTV